MLLVLGSVEPEGHLDQEESHLSHEKFPKYDHLKETITCKVTERGT